ncbi:MAG: diguanylate cyclase [Gaiellaceae bacterium]
MHPSRARRLTVQIALTLLALALIPVALVGVSMTRSSEAAERGRLDAQVGLSLQAAVSDIEGALLATETNVQNAARSTALIDAIRRDNRAEIARRLPPGTTVTIDGATIGRRPPVALTRSVVVEIGHRAVAEISSSLPLTSAVLAHLGQPLPVAGTTFAVVDKSGAIVVGQDPGSTLPTRGDVTLGGTRYRTYSAGLGVVPYRLQALVPERHFQQAVSSQRKRLALIVGLTVFVALALVFAFGGSMLTSLRELFRRAEHAGTDDLTSLPNRRVFKEALMHEIQRAKRYGTPLSLTLFDLDHFKRVNDTHGHPAGDRVLVAATHAVERNLRESDVFARVGGEEFAVLLPNTSEEGAVDFAERLRAALQAISPLALEVDAQITASFGVVEFDRDSDDSTGERLIAAADAALYNAKWLGRNRVFSARVPEHDEVS